MSDALIERVKRAIHSRAKFIIEKKNELGEKSFRRLLEKDLRLNKRQLDENEVKETIGKLLLGVIESGTIEETDDSKDDSDDSEDEYSDDDDEEVKRKRKKSKRSEEKQPTRRTRTETETPNAKVSKLRKLCKDAGITKATHVFMKFKTNKEREEALERLLGERALDIRATARECAKVKEEIEREKDLEDIDASNIIQGGRRRNTRTQVNYKGLDASDDSEEEEEEEEESDVEIESDSDEERKKKLKKKKKEKKTLKKKSSSDSNTNNTKPNSSLKKVQKSASPKAFTAASSSDDDE